MTSRCNTTLSQLCMHLLLQENLGQMGRGCESLGDDGDPEIVDVFSGQLGQRFRHQ